MEVVDRYLNRIKIKVSSLGVDLKNYFIQILFFNSYLNLKNTLIEKNLKKDIFLSIPYYSRDCQNVFIPFSRQLKKY